MSEQYTPKVGHVLILHPGGYANQKAVVTVKRVTPGGRITIDQDANAVQYRPDDRFGGGWVAPRTSSYNAPARLTVPEPGQVEQIQHEWRAIRAKDRIDRIPTDTLKKMPGDLILSLHTAVDRVYAAAKEMEAAREGKK